MFFDDNLREDRSILKAVRLEVSALDSSPLPIDLDFIKDHCSIDSTDFDTLVETYLYASILWAEGFMHRTIYSRSHVWVLKEFPYLANSEIQLPRGKTQSVESIVYSLNGSTITLTGPSSSPAGTGYQEDLTGDHGGVLLPTRTECWPSTDYDVPAPVKINFTAGWATASVPQQITQAVLFSIDDMFELRGAQDVANKGANLQLRESLLLPFKLNRFYNA